MNKFSVTAFLLLLCIISQAQIINFPDPVFKSILVNDGGGIGWNPTTMQPISIQNIDTNEDGEIDQSEAALITSLVFDVHDCTNLEGIEYFINLKSLNCQSNYITELDVSALLQLEVLSCGLNQITSLNVNNLSQLKFLEFGSNPISDINFTGLDSLEFLESSDCPISSIDFSLLPSLEYFIGVFCPFTSLDFSQNPLLGAFEIENCPNLLSINLKNGSFLAPNFDYPQLIGLQNLQFICVDEGEEENVSEIFGIVPGEESNIVLSTNCDDNPFASFYTFQGTGILDANNNGCDATDVGLANLKLQITDSDGETRFVYANNQGQYAIYFNELDTFTITPILENSTYYSVSPESVTVTFPEDGSTVAQNFCITPNEIHQDLSVLVHPYEQNSAGFSSSYIVRYKNEGNTTQNGTVSFQYDTSVLNLLSVNPNQDQTDSGLISWNFTDLFPNEERFVFMDILLNSPMDNPPLNAGDVLTFTATISGDTDENPLDNNFVFEQTVVNSYDPNQITCLEGEILPTNMIGKELHYLIDFENLGTANAQNVVVRLDIDISKFDINTLTPLHGSHDFVTNLDANGNLEFVFENIQLPFDDANNDGFVVFKIKSNEDLIEGDFVENTAGIYFDFNFPIITNTSTTFFQDTLFNALVDSNSFDFKIYPNPADDFIQIQSNYGRNSSSITIFNTLGQLIKDFENPSNILDVSFLESGTYFLRIKFGDYFVTQKLLKH
uniref:DUF7619 domain-containing protein n=2 Tax=Flavobacterium sp. TaxID=239 RepID=UPI0040497D6E